MTTLWTWYKALRTRHRMQSALLRNPYYMTGRSFILRETRVLCEWPKPRFTWRSITPNDTRSAEIYQFWKRGRSE